jgi:hypothetical protein
MTFGGRLLWASAVVLVDLITIGIPLTAMFAAYVLLARPAWFRDWINELYTD